MALVAAEFVPIKSNTDIAGLIDMHSAMLYRFCRSVTYSKEDAEDIFQETWVTILQKPLKLEMVKNPKSFLCREALSLWKSRQRKYARRKRLAPEASLNSEIDSGQDVEEEFFRKAEKEFVQKLIDKLSEKYRIPLILYYNVEMDVAEIAKTLSLPAGTVKSRLFTARQEIKKGVEKYEAE